MSEQAHLIIRSDVPFNAEPTLSRLRAHLVTSTDDFYVRSHGDVPEVDPHVFRLTLAGNVEKALSLSLQELREQFEEHSVEAVIQCAGNRREDLDKVRPVSGDLWAPGAIGNAVWTGVRLADVLASAGAEANAEMHVAFSSLDECTVGGKTFKYGASIPMTKAMSPEVLLAYAMNGEPLAAKHGFPLRVVTPGFAGVRSPKWVTAIEVRDTPSDNPIQAEDYKLLPPDILSTDEIDWARGLTINEMPINSAICEPAADAEVPAGPVTIRGYAMATDREIVRVDVSADGGKTWRQATLECNVKPWSWTFWDAEVHLVAGRQELVVRAWDAASQTQPEDASATWNIKGYLGTAWHRIAVTAVQPPSFPTERPTKADTRLQPS